MALVKLVCAIVGVAKSMFAVEIDTGQMMVELKDAIKAMNKNDLKNVDAGKLQLFLTKNGDAWLPDNDSLDEILRGRTLDTSYTEMLHGSWELKNPKYLGPNVSLGSGVIHVLVVVPKPQAAVGIARSQSASTQMLKAVDDAVLTKRKRYVHSQMDLTEGRSLLLEMNIELTVAHSVPFTIRDQDPAHVAAFKWKSILGKNGKKIMLTEEQQRERYRKYVEDNIRDVLETENLCVVSVEEGQDILSVKVPGYDIELVGRADLLIMSDVVKEHSHYLWRCLA
ncbi:hypothetical protein V7S43_009930 [Phytophthora oleae]|uniref:Crinkler effector protein N-terminal domain-containing protein n=1 Tax=Phytophthora oleae TaxID=2107226 RepID=A0ABD3FHD2_9STRA